MISFSKWTDVALIAFFVTAISLPTLDTLAGLDPVDAPYDNRPSAPAPQLYGGLGLVREFPAEFEAYFKDGFGFRNSLIKGHCLAKYHLLHESGADRVLLGKDGWLFFTGNKAVECYRGLDPFTERELEAWRLLLEGRRDALAERGIRYLFLLVPNKHTVYPEHLPDRLNVVSETSRLDQLTDHLRAHSDVDFIDLRDVLIQSKRRGQMYDRTGTHWTAQGRFFAYGVISELVAQWLPEITPLVPSEFRSREVEVPGLELAQMLGLQEELREVVLRVVPRTASANRDPAVAEDLRSSMGIHRSRKLQVYVGEDASLPRLMLVGDSFGNSLIKMLAEDYSRSVYIRDQFDLELIDREEPDVVINQVAERFLMTKNPVKMGANIDRGAGSKD